MQTFISAVMFFIVFGSVLFLAYVTTKFIGTRTNRIIKGKYVKIIETVNLGFDSKLHLVKAGDEFVLISTSGKNVQVLTKVELDAYSADETETGDNSFKFKEVFGKYIQGFAKNREEIPFSEAESGDKEQSGNSPVFNANLDRLRRITASIASHKAEDGEGNTNEN
ncbi:flagellar biosynthetic protein FliO [Acetivibrio mesophilus]|uniref:Flagellar biogenesis protein n=1 Tax=Acetivibrio mesophilus TaxID=2487273 RepID=A0A4Q0IAZ6_9FIRM|nr:flagellar biosynthetic protein FliO [Acetivibrio mesophilus]ODM25666.1 flagellar biogenesis protein [Clostridium sp. Bc-iso-3]RXE60252.1 flagellar biogenesis protein [Acetivibrio mesophilus]HHV29879.1 flagellar biosynthetic protein FliO [Clostridium sp.]